jgi:hypothetical protein
VPGIPADYAKRGRPARAGRSGPTFADWFPNHTRSIAQQRHQVIHGRLIKQREVRERTLELGAKQKEALSRRNWSLEALLSGPGPDLLTEDVVARV